MSFALGKIFWFLTAPANLLLLFVAAGWVLLVLGARRLGHGLLALGVLGMAAIAVLPVGAWLLTPLEDRFPRLDRVDEPVAGIVVLGGSIDSALSAARGHPALTQYGDRLVAAAILARRHPDARVLVTSGEAALLPQGHSEGPYMRQMLIDLGVAPERILLEEKSRNTAENASMARLVAAPGPDDRWLLVTSAFHMPRAVGCFRRLGWDVVPYPTDFMTTGRGGLSFGFNLKAGLERTHLAVKEWLALAAYRLLDHTDTLFPGPLTTGPSAARP
ncbi:uncharacterized SAM-binding protein YcdF (DUF218 family) [Stella humosa]|uniref:Uncharacterized SAM-binding protein YcdF (DUF218 family) n=1 Tax=Stella humosa TaxID=94 RepID=A0A3N1MCY6_9PROT|nr:YdcF family protein [Stella humosa]ROQ01591.1 uncharacterized SAM-binding protein YcdF (DUF218 family) [Stella humosa]BBK31971.1 hypothetical protein STHU_26050 [Stella humosa]